MTLVVKILTAAAIVCLLLWGAFLALGAQPLKENSSLTVIYGEDEDFYADAEVYQKVRNDTLLFVHLPRARQAYRWWAIDFLNATIAPIPSPRSLGSRKYLLRGGQEGPAIGNTNVQEKWSWRFTETGTAFSGNGFMCSVTKSKSK